MGDDVYLLWVVTASTKKSIGAALSCTVSFKFMSPNRTLNLWQGKKLKKV